MRLYKGQFKQLDQFITRIQRKAMNWNKSMNFLAKLANLANQEASQHAQDQELHHFMLRVMPSDVLQPVTLAKLARVVQDRVALLPADMLKLPRKAATGAVRIL